MKRIVLGTAGHIDHGKTLLTKALTGMDCDRLAEEKARGITIELGFAPMTLSDGTRISLIDVPGHEKFIRTMMAGVSGIDGVLLVIAADDGVMPQTREHLDILELMGVPRGIVVLTKRDLAEEAQLARVTAQVKELTAGTFLENAPVCPVSAVTGEGMDELRRAMEKLVAEAGEKDCMRPFRLPADRAFSVDGFGTVITGTLTEGTVRVGDPVEIGNQAGTVRSLQVHGTDVKEARAGMRTAMSFSGLDKSAVQRGCTAAEPDSLLYTDLLTAKIRILPDCPYAIRNSSRIHLFHGTEELVGKLRLLDGDKLTAGQTGFAQIRLAKSIPVRWDDRFILRFFSPVVTVGGGTVLACDGRRLRRCDPAVRERLTRLSDPETRLACRVEDRGLLPISRERLRKYSNLSSGDALSVPGTLELIPGTVISRQAVSAMEAQVLQAMASFHEEYPLQPGMAVPAYRSRFAPGEPADELLEYWKEQGVLTGENGFVSLPDFVPVFTQEHKIMQRKLLHYYRDAWFYAPDLKAVKERFGRFGKLFEQVLANMRMNEMLIPLTPRYWVHFEAYRQACEILRDLGAEGKPVTLGQFRTAAGISRKYSQLFLEYWDRRGVTRRVGDTHILL